MIGLITTARHEREIAAKDAEIAGLMKRLEDTARRHAITEREACDQATVIGGHEKTIADLRERLWSNQLVAARDRELLAATKARLAPFIAKRPRDAKGHFLPTKGRE